MVEPDLPGRCGTEGAAPGHADGGVARPVRCPVPARHAPVRRSVLRMAERAAVPLARRVNGAGRVSPASGKGDQMAGLPQALR